MSFWKRDVGFKAFGAKVTPEDIEKYESSMNVKLTDDFKIFLTTQNGGIPPRNKRTIRLPENEEYFVEVAIFFGLNNSNPDYDLYRQFEQVNGRWPWIRLVPIAADINKNVFCLLGQKGNAQVVVLCDLSEPGLHMHPIAKDFDSFFAMMANSD